MTAAYVGKIWDYHKKKLIKCNAHSLVKHGRKNLNMEVRLLLKLSSVK